jgi:DNA topoisomerase-1
VIGIHPETHEKIEAGIGRFGPYVRMGAVYGSLDRDDDILSVGINRAVDLLARKLASVRSLGPHPRDQEAVTVRKGRFGPYVQHAKTVANLPRGVSMDELTLDEAVSLLGEKGKQLRPRGGKGGKSAKGAAGRRGRSAAEGAPKTAEAPARAASGQKAAKSKKAAAKTKAAPKKRAAKKKSAGRKSGAKAARLKAAE